jgi:hypothetical protein
VIREIVHNNKFYSGDNFIFILFFLVVGLMLFKPNKLLAFTHLQSPLRDSAGDDFSAKSIRGITAGVPIITQINYFFILNGDDRTKTVIVRFPCIGNYAVYTSL